MTVIELGRLRTGDWIRWHSKLDHHIDGKITAVYADTVRVDWEDGYVASIPYAILLRETFKPLEA